MRIEQLSRASIVHAARLWCSDFAEVRELVLRRARVFTRPAAILPELTETRQAGKALHVDMADIGHHKEVAELMHCSKSAKERPVYKVSKLRGS